MNTPEKKIELISDKKFLKLIDIRYEKDAHYYAATRRALGSTFAILSEKEGKLELSDAVTVVLVIEEKGSRKLYLNYEYRYPAGRFLLSPVAGLIDKEDREGADKLLEELKNSDKPIEELTKEYEHVITNVLRTTAVREIYEETGYDAKNAEFTILSPAVFSSPGITDESNAMVKCVMKLNENENVKANPVGTEVFSGHELLSKDEAKEILKKGRDKFGNFIPVYTYVALNEFVNETIY